MSCFTCTWLDSHLGGYSNDLIACLGPQTPLDSWLSRASKELVDEINEPWVLSLELQLELDLEPVYSSITLLEFDVPAR